MLNLIMKNDRQITIAQIVVVIILTPPPPPPLPRQKVIILTLTKSPIFVIPPGQVIYPIIYHLY